MAADNDTDLEMDLPDFTRRSFTLGKEIDDATQIAQALETGQIPSDDNLLPYYADLYFPNAQARPSSVLIEESRANWSQYYLRQVWWGIALLETQLKKPTARTLHNTFTTIAAWSEQDQRLHVEAIENLTNECTQSIDALSKDGFSTEKLASKLHRTLSEDHSGILQVINSEARYLAFVDTSLRQYFRMFTESAHAILDTCRNDMAETYILYMRSNNRSRNSRQMIEELRYQGTICGQELSRAAQFHDLAGTTLQNLKDNINECEQRITAYGGLAPRDSKPCLN